MTHIPGIPIDYEPPSEWKQSLAKCTCGSKDVKYRIHESSCGGYEDAEYHCMDCDKTWWVDGPDA